MIGSVVLLLVGCTSTTDASIDVGSSQIPSTSPAKLNSKDCSVLITTTYDLESAVQSELNGESDPEALQTMNQLVPVFQELQAKYSQTPKSEAEIWLEQMATDLVSITDEINTNGKLMNTELGSQLTTNIDSLDQFCPSAE